MTSMVIILHLSIHKFFFVISTINANRCTKRYAQYQLELFMIRFSFSISLSELNIILVLSNIFFSLFVQINNFLSYINL